MRLLGDLFAEAAPLFRTLGLLLVILGGAALNRAGAWREPSCRTAARLRLTMALRCVGYAIIGVGLAVVATSAVYLHFPHMANFSYWVSTETDGLLVLARFAAFAVVLLGGTVIWGGKLLGRPAGGPRASVDVYFSRAACGVGYLLVVCGIVVVAAVATKLSFSGRVSVPRLVNDAKEAGIYYLVSVLM